MVCQQRGHNQNEYSRAADKRCRIASLQVQDEHADDIEQEQQRDGDSQPFAQPCTHIDRSRLIRSGCREV
ncbi:hypothetical protein D3C80_1763390 [compost metagenome]